MHIILKVCDYELVTPRYAHRPVWYNKLACIRSFINAAELAKDYISGITWLHDGPEGPLHELVQNSTGEIVKTQGLGVHGAVFKSNEIAESIQDDLCFIDDDYLHTSNSIIAIAKALPRLGLVTGYDNPDRYNLTDDIDYKIEIVWDHASDSHWRTCESACFTYAIRRDIWDNNSWLKLTANDRESFRRFHRQGQPLWSPIPGLYTHCNNTTRTSSVSPKVNWQEISDRWC